MTAKPFLKWAGGKARLFPVLQALMPGRFARYIEPFVGGGAVFFGLGLPGERCVLADVNDELVNAYMRVAFNTEALLGELSEMPVDEETFYIIRDWDRTHDIASLSHVERAARFLYINKCGFNGLWRVNRDGQCNVPWGKKPPDFIPFDKAALLSAAHALKGAAIMCAPFEYTLGRAQPGDFAYLDPPYDGTFDGYTDGGFGADAQERLAACVREVAGRGVKVMLSNADTPRVRALYRGFDIRKVEGPRSISRDGEGRKPATELVIRTYTGSA